MWPKTSWTFKGRSFFVVIYKKREKNRRKIQRQIETKRNNKETAGFFFLSRERTTTLMTSSNDNKDSFLPHAASRLVLFTNLKKKKKDKKQQTEREKEQRKKAVERNKEEGDFWRRGEGLQVVVLGLNWLTHLGRCDVLPWVGGSAGGSGLWSEPESSLGFHSACTCVFVCGLFFFFYPISFITKLQLVKWCLIPMTIRLPSSFLPQLSHVPFASQTVSISWLHDWHLYEVGLSEEALYVSTVHSSIGHPQSAGWLFIH